MAIEANLACFLVGAAKRGITFRRTAMIGRQNVHMRPATLRHILKGFRFAIAKDVLDGLLAVCATIEGYAEPLLSALGAEEIVSIDASSYEGAQIVHDMNQPIPASLTGRFDVVIDGGSLEHVFNIPMAFRNCMEMLSVDGSFFSASAMNDHAGHGFYQFSPELLFRVFSKENGFCIERLVICEASVADVGAWFEAKDPATTGQRLQIEGGGPTYLLLHARKATANVRVLAAPVQQSDWTAMWHEPRQMARERIRIAGLAPLPSLPSTLIGLVRALMRLEAAASVAWIVTGPLLRLCERVSRRIMFHRLGSASVPRL